MGTFRVRKNINVIPGLLRLNASGSASRAKGAKGGASWTIHLGKWIGYNTRDGRWSVNPPGPGSWQSGTRTQRKANRQQKRTERAAETVAERERWEQYWSQPRRQQQGTVPIVALAAPPRPQPQQQTAGACGARTRDGSPCQNGAGCSIRSHVRPRTGGRP